MSAGADHPELEQLEACAEIAPGQPANAEAAQVLAHAELCADCARELAWLRREHQIFAARIASSGSAPASNEAEVARLWSGVAARIDASSALAANERKPPLVAVGRSPRTWFSSLIRPRSLVALALPIAAVLAIALRPSVAPRALTAAPRTLLADEDTDAEATPDPRVALALTKAEVDTAHAVEVLEKEAAALRPRLPADEARGWDKSLGRARARLDAARLASAQALNDDDRVQSRLRVLGGYTRYLRSLQEMVKDTEETRP